MRPTAQPATPRRRAAGLWFVLAAVLVAGCTPPEKRLTGQRLPIDLPLSASIAAETGARVALPEATNRALSLRLPAAVSNTDWTHRGGTPTHLMPHLALAAAPAPLWAVPIGAAERRDRRITAAPVISGGQIVVMDAEGTVAALSRGDGSTLWRFDTRPGAEGPEGFPAGGGLATDGTRVLVATTAGELIALAADTGVELWRQRFDAPLAGSPTLRETLVFVQGRDGTAWALDLRDGRQRWMLPGQPATAGIAAAAAPAATAGTVVFALTGAVLTAARTAAPTPEGAPVWTSSVPGARPGIAAALVRDISGDPVIERDRVYAGSSAGRTAALDLATGAVLWVADEGAMGPVWPVNDAVFLVSDRNRLVRLDAATGATVWSVPLPGYLREGAKRSEMQSHYGPLLAGGRLIVASSDGAIRFFNPVDGAETGQLAIPGGAAAAPAIAEGTLYVVSRKGELHAFR